MISHTNTQWGDFSQCCFEATILSWRNTHTRTAVHVRIHTSKCVRHIHSHAHTRLSKQAFGSRHCLPLLRSWFQRLPKMSLLMQLVCCYGFRQEILSQNVQNKEAVSRLCFPRSHATPLRTHSHMYTHILKGSKICVCSTDSLLPLSVSDPSSSCWEMCSLTDPLRRDVWVNSTDRWSGVLQHNLVYLTYRAYVPK